jgi:hypothetical protein
MPKDFQCEVTGCIHAFHTKSQLKAHYLSYKHHLLQLRNVFSSEKLAELSLSTELIDSKIEKGQKKQKESEP